MTDRKTVGLVFIDRFADWEYGLLSASAVEWFGAKVVALSPGGKPVVSVSGLEISGQRGLETAENADLDALAVIGSDLWSTAGAPDPVRLLDALAARGVVGGICAGTLPLARAGLFESRKHTSNGRVWIADQLSTYPGQGNYLDVPYAVADGNVVSAPGSAPATFAAAFLEALYPEAGETIAQMRGLFSGEHARS